MHMQYTYSLKIVAPKLLDKEISQILEVEPNVPIGNWEYEIIEKDTDPPVDFIQVFMEILEPRIDRLLELGITRDDISVWLLYEYEDQCNMEFSPAQMSRLAQNEITLCISCYQMESEEYDSSSNG